MSRPLDIDRDKLRRNAREHLSRGAVTEAYGAERERVIEVLNQVLATEVVCALRYRNNYHVAHGIHAEPVAQEFLEHAQQEEDHADRLMARIVQLGGEPNLDPRGLAERAHAEYHGSGSMRDMLRENLIAERIAIDSYTQIVRWLGDRDPTTRRLMEEILAQEEEHADDLATLLEGSRFDGP
jgi:bacterioferritin